MVSPSSISGDGGESLLACLSLSGIAWLVIESYSSQEGKAWALRGGGSHDSPTVRIPSKHSGPLLRASFTTCLGS